MPVHLAESQERLRFGEVQCFMCCTSGSGKAANNPLKLQQKRYVVISYNKFAEGRNLFTLDFYKNVSKYEKKCLHHQEPMHVEMLRGFTKGVINNESKDKYIAMIFKSFTIVITMKGNNADIDRHIKDCTLLFKEHFGHVMTRSIKVEDYPDDARVTFQKESTNRILISSTKTRISVCSETHHHMCLYTWNYSDITLPETSGNILRLDVSQSADHHGTYTFTSGHSHNIRKRLLEAKIEFEDPTYESVDPDILVSSSSEGAHSFHCPPPPPPPNIWNRHQSQDSIVSAPPAPSASYHQQLNIGQHSGGAEAQFVRIPSESRSESFLCHMSNSGSFLSDFVSAHDIHTTDDSYLTTCETCDRVYANYTSKAQAASLANSPTSPSSFNIDLGQDLNLDTYDIDLNEYVQQNHEEVITVLESQSSSRNTSVFIKTCASSSGLISPADSSSSEPSPQSSNNVEPCGPTRKISMPCQGTYRWNELCLNISETFSSEAYSARTPVATLEIFKTIDRVLRGKPPSSDTLQLGHRVRCQMCMRLYLPSCNTAGTCMEDWQLLGEAIGLCVDAINLISAIVKNHSLAYPAAEVVLRHWQYVYNKYGVTDDDGKCPHACTKDSLVSILRQMKREDLVELALSECPSPRLQQLDTF